MIFGRLPVRGLPYPRWRSCYIYVAISATAGFQLAVAVMHRVTEPVSNRQEHGLSSDRRVYSVTRLWAKKRILAKIPRRTLTFPLKCQAVPVIRTARDLQDDSSDYHSTHPWGRLAGLPKCASRRDLVEQAVSGDSAGHSGTRSGDLASDNAGTG